MYVYKISNNINNKIYIGITNDYKRRWREHKNNYNKNSIIAKAIQKYGEENFIFEILYSGLSLEEANNKEIELIKKYNSFVPNGYNISSGGGVQKGSENGNAKLTKEQAQYILDNRNQPMYVLYEQFNEIISYATFKNIYHHQTYTDLQTTVDEYPYNVEYSAQFTSGGKLDYPDIVSLRQRYANIEYWEDVYKDYKDLYPDKWTFWQIYTGNKFKLVMPEVFSEENKRKHKALGKNGDKNGRAKLTSKDVLEIRKLHKDGVSNSEIYKLYPQVTPTSIRGVINGTTWKHLL